MPPAGTGSGDRTPTGPILVTGVPRSGTTWLARLLAHAPGTALAGREPMNPRGRQYSLAGTLEGWARLTEPTRRQRVALALAYRGLNPWVYSRYGSRQWAAPWPGTRMVVKDPFAMLSLPAVTRVARAVPVLVYRHPGAVLASYQRMGWSPDTAELQRLVERSRGAGGPDLADLPAPGSVSPAVELGTFWATLHAFALADVEAGTPVVVVSHKELAVGGPAAGRRLAETLGLTWNDAMEAGLARSAAAASAPTAQPTQLHNFDRAPAQVAEEWRERLSPHDVEEIESVTAPMISQLEAARLRLRQ